MAVNTNKSTDINHLQMIENIVKVVVDKVYTIPKSKMISEIEISEDKTESETKGLNDIMTDLVTNKFLETEESISQFLQLITGQKILFL